MITYTIQGFDLHQPEEGFQLMQNSAFAPPIAPRRVDLLVPRMHGEVPLWDDELDAAKLSLRVRISDPDPEQLQFKWEHLRALMWTGSNQGLTIRRESGTQPTPQVTSTFGQLETMTQPDFWCAAGMVDTVMLFNIPSGRWQSIEIFEESLDTNTSSQELDFVNESTAPNTNMLFRFQGPITASNAWNEAHDDTNQTGFRILPGQTVASDEYVLVDPQNYKAWLNTVSDFDARHTDISSGLHVRGMNMISLVSIPSFQIGVRTSNIRTARSASATDTTLVVQGRRTYI